MTDLLDLEARDPDAVLRYGAAPQQIADRYRPTAPEHGTVVLVHGGFWRARWDRTHLRPLAAALADRGHDVLLPEYRRVGDPGGGWPGTGDDVRALLAALPVLLGGDPRVVLVGHSAGGQLAVWSQAAHPSPFVRAVVALAGVVDLQAAADRHLSDDAVGELLGAEPLAAADPLRLPTPSVPVVLVHGDADSDVPIALSRAYAARHPEVRLLELPGAEHFDLVDPRAPAFETLLALLR
ncbi:alpha/beta hydrolase [Rathayibacter sp. ZW T2_19]|uniref:Alpha/beta hydrolase n=1 Tax=Rathayibacter rubneri TaxID=2950106 RepID=A0A9X2E0L9_9MICO|nr:alpha/beta hydrolase [Rathayibacter rubneri]MCM6764437.1 alpha/beta hydrolase [Rathayibacter rubneri]